MNRGAGHQQVFFTQQDGRQFERLLSDAHTLFGVEVHAYCLMRNHYHLLLHCPETGLSPFMQHVGAIYTRRLNERLGRDGPLFRSRFHSILIDSAEYLAWAGRYIHRNPLDVSPSVRLDQYRWSSFRYYAGRLATPSWIRTSMLLDMFGGSRASYAEFVDGETTHRATAPTTLAAIIDMLLEEADWTIDERRGLNRTVAIEMLSHCDADIRTGLEQLLAFPSGDARRMAQLRARRRVEQLPELSRVVAIALELAA